MATSTNPTSDSYFPYFLPTACFAIFRWHDSGTFIPFYMFYPTHTLFNYKQKIILIQLLSELKFCLSILRSYKRNKAMWMFLALESHQYHRFPNTTCFRPLPWRKTCESKSDRIYILEISSHAIVWIQFCSENLSYPDGYRF